MLSCVSGALLFPFNSLVDAIQNYTQQSVDPLKMPSGPVTRLRAKRFKEALSGLIHQHEEMIRTCFNTSSRHFDEKLITIIQTLEGPNEEGLSLGSNEFLT